MSEPATAPALEYDGRPLRHLVARFARPYWLRFTVGLVGIMLARIPQMVPAVLIGVAIDALLLSNTAYELPLVPDAWIPVRPDDQAVFTVAVLAGAVVAEVVLDYASRFAYDRAFLETLHDVRTATYDEVTGLSMAYFDGERSGEIMSVLNNDVNNMEDFAEAARTFAEYSSDFGVALAFMWIIHWELTLSLLVVPVAVVVTSRIYATRLGPRYEAVRESVGRINSRLRDVIDGIGTVKAFNRESHERDRLRGFSRKYKEHQWSTLRLRIVYNVVTFSLGGVVIWGLFLLGPWWIINGPPLFFSQDLTAGTFVTFLIFAGSFTMPLRRIAVDVLDEYENAQASGERVLGLLEGDHDTEDLYEGGPLEVTDGRVAYDGVSFSYPGSAEETISDVDFSAEGGEFVGVVGATGAGKSTLLKLLFRFYDPDEGSIRIDGQDVADVELASLRRHLGYVSQDPFLFYGTVRENIAYAQTDPDHEEIVRAAKRAGAHEFIQDLPDGYDTMVGERGTRLSGGQRQRVSIARTILCDPDVLVLDEATSHVDNETELQIQQSLDDLAADRTTFVIAHRLSTVRDADAILVLDDGELVERGTHEELLSADGVYANLWRVQVGEVDALSEEFVQRAISREEVPR